MYIIFGSWPVQADNFHPTGNIEDNSAMYAISLGRSVIPDEVSPFWPYKIIPGSTVGGADSDVLRSKTFTQFTQLSEGVYKRVSAEGMSVSAVPGDKVELWWYPYNIAGHTVGIKGSWLFLGPYQEAGIEEILDINGQIYRNIVYFEQGNLRTKGGLSVSTGSLGNMLPVSLGGYALMAKKIFSATVKSPILLKELRYICPGEYGNVKNEIKYSLVLENVGVNQETVLTPGTDRFIVPPSELVEREGYVPMANGSAFSVDVLGATTRCLGTKLASPIDSPDSHVLLASRDDLNQWYWGGIAVEVPSVEDGELYCITRVPYSIASELPNCQLPPEYSMDLASEISIHEDETQAFAIKITNNGGDPSEAVSLILTVPEVLDQYLRIDENEVKKRQFDHNGEYTYPGVKVSAQGEMGWVVHVTGALAVSGLRLTLQFAQLKREVPVVVVQVTPMPTVVTPTPQITVTPTVTTEQTLKTKLTSKGVLCTEVGAVWSGVITVLAEEVRDINLGITYDAENNSAMTKKVTVGFGGATIDVDLTVGKEKIVALGNPETPGEYSVKAIFRPPLSGTIRVGLADGVVTAATSVACPVGIPQKHVAVVGAGSEKQSQATTAIPTRSMLLGASATAILLATSTTPDWSLRSVFFANYWHYYLIPLLILAILLLAVLPRTRRRKNDQVSGV